MTSGESIIPISILTDTNSEELAYPHIFITSKFGYKYQNEVELNQILNILISAF